MLGMPVNEKKVAEFQERMETVLDQLETIWLKDHPFIAGDHVTIADLLAACELEQPSTYVCIHSWLNGNIGLSIKVAYMKLGPILLCRFIYWLIFHLKIALHDVFKVAIDSFLLSVYKWYLQKFR